MAIVSVIKCGNISLECVKKVLKPLEPLKIKNGFTVAVKPNLCTNTKGDKGATTDMKLVDALVSYLNSNFKRLKILIVESQSWGGISTEQVFKDTGYDSFKKKYSNVELVNLTSLQEKKFYKNPKFLYFNKESSLTKLPVLFKSIDYFISFAKLKTHTSSKMTCVLKNQFGCLPLSYKFYYHPELDDVTLDLNRLLNPQLCLVDGVYSLDGLGPIHGVVKKTNILIAGNDALATDAVAARVIGYNPLSIPIIKKSVKEGYGSINYELFDNGLLEKDYGFMKVSHLGFLMNRLYFWLQGRIRLFHRLGYKLTIMRQKKKLKLRGEE